MTTTYLPNRYIGEPAVNDSGWGVTANASFVNIDTAFGGNQAFNLGSASGTVGVTATSYNGAYPANTASYIPLSWTLTGTLTANVTLQIPSGVGGHWIVNNQCTMGSYTIVVAASGGSTSVTLAAGAQLVYSDGQGNLYPVTPTFSVTELSVSLSSSNVTLSATQAAATYVTLSGTLSANVNVNWPVSPFGLCYVVNNTTGGFTVTLQNVGAGTSFVIPQTGVPFPIFHDATNIVLLNPTALQLLAYLGIDAVISIAGATSLTTAQVGGLVEWSGSTAYTVSMPTMGSVRGGFTFYNGSSVSQTIFTGSGVFSGSNSSGSSTQSVSAGASLRVKWDGTNWVVTDYNAPAAPSLTPLAITGGMPTAMSGTNTTAAITISAFTATDTTATVQISAVGSTSWAVSNGNAANGYAGGTTLPNSSTIHMYACKGGSGVCTYASTTFGLSAASAPAGYTSYIRRLFSFNTNSSGAPIAYTPIEGAGGDLHGNLAAVATDVNTASATNSRSLVALTLPTGFPVIWQGRFFTTSTAAVIVSPSEPDVAVTNAASTSPGYDAPSTLTPYAISRQVFTNSSGQVGLRAATASGTWSVFTTGFIDPRRV